MPKSRTLDQWLANGYKEELSNDETAGVTEMLLSLKPDFDNSNAKLESLERMNTMNNQIANNSSKTWEWYQQNAPQELEAMSANNPGAFAQLYKAEYGVFPDDHKSNTKQIIEETKTEPQGVIKNWNWYQENAPQELEAMSKSNPTAFAELYKTEYGCYPKGNQFNNK